MFIAVPRKENGWVAVDIRLALALTQANRLLTRAAPGEGFRRIVLFSDFQNSSWRSRDNVVLAPGIELAVRNVGGKAVPNVFVERVAVPRLAVAGGLSEVVSANIRNLTDKPLETVVLELKTIY